MAKLSELTKEHGLPLKVRRPGWVAVDYFEIKFKDVDNIYVGITNVGRWYTAIDEEDWQIYKEPAPKMRVWVSGDAIRLSGYDPNQRSVSTWIDRTRELAEVLRDELGE